MDKLLIQYLYTWTLVHMDKLLVQLLVDIQNVQVDGPFHIQG